MVVGIGARPATGWLAGTAVERGPDGSITTDAYLRTSLPGVYAVGDCASFPSGRYGKRLLVHHWDNALQGPRTVAANILAGEQAQVYDPVPYFWSEQFGRFVQYAGHHGEADTLLLRGDLAKPLLVGVLAPGRSPGRRPGRGTPPRPGAGPQAHRDGRPSRPGQGRPLGPAEVRSGLTVVRAPPRHGPRPGRGRSGTGGGAEMAGLCL